MTRFPPSFLDEIKDRLPISQVIGKRVAWDRRKTNAARGDYWACCPFHGEKSPSFHCEDRKGRYHCFGCGVSGDHFRFLVELERLSFPESVARLAADAGLPMPVIDRQTAEREEKRATLYDVLEMAAAFFEEQLQSAAGARARAYLRDRSVALAAQKTFRLGFAPDSRNALKEFLASKSATREQIEACGLVVHGSDIPVSYDRFRDRIMFPIGDSQGRIIAFGGRALASGAPAKYLNSPETELFHKSAILYNFSRARKIAHDRREIVAVEGYLDVIALHMAGIENAVAPLGTALTENQMELLWRLAKEPVLSFDGDAAGLKAAYRSIDMLLPSLKPGFSVRYALLPEGRDPDDLVRAEGADAMREVIDAALPLSEMIWRRETSSGRFETPEKRAALEARLRELAGQVRDENVRRHYGQEFAGRLAGLFGGARAAPARDGTNRNTWRPQAKNAALRLGPSPSLLNSSLMKRGSFRVPLREAVLIATIVNHPAILSVGFEEFSNLGFGAAPALSLQQAILGVFADWEALGHAASSGELIERLTAEGHGDLLAALDRQLRENRIWQALADAAFEDALNGWRQALSLHLRAHHLKRELKAAESALAAEDGEANFERLVEIRNEIARAEGVEALIEGFGVSSGRPARNY